jgi:hypothetical protein
MLHHEFGPGFWGSVLVSLLLLHNSSHTTARHVLKPDLGSRCLSGPEQDEICMHGNS